MYEFVDEVADVEAVPEQFRALYAKPENGTTFKLQKDNPMVRGAIEAVVGLHKTLKTVRGELDSAKKIKVDLTPLKDFGEDPTAIATTFGTKLKELQDQLASKGNKQLDLDNLRKDMTKAHEAEKTAWAARAKGLQDQLFTHLVESTAKSAVAEVAVDIDLAMPFVLKNIKTMEEDGAIKVLIVDDQGNRRYGATGKDLTIVELVNEMQSNKKFAPLWKSKTPSGGGTPPGSSGMRGGNKAGTGELTSSQKISQGLNAKGGVVRGAGAR